MDIPSPAQLKSLFSATETADNELARLKVAQRNLPADSPLAAEVNARIAQGEKLKAQYASTLYAARDFYNWIVAQTEGAGASLSDVYASVKKSLGLGVLPLIPVVIAATAVSAALVGMTGFITSAASTNKRVDAWNSTFNKSLQAGNTPAQAAAIANGMTKTQAEGDKGFSGELAAQIGTGLKWAALAFAMYKIAQKMGWIPK